MGTITPPRIFTRAPVYTRRDPDVLAGPYPLLTLRDWEQCVIVCSLPLSLRKLLLSYWFCPANDKCRRFQQTAGHWNPWLDGVFSAQTSLSDLRRSLRKAVAAIWLLLDTPLLRCSGMARGMLLVEQGKYLRETLEALCNKPGALPAEVELQEALLDLTGRTVRASSLLTLQFQHLWLRREGA